jgi:hypothetical protein
MRQRGIRLIYRCLCATPAQHPKNHESKFALSLDHSAKACPPRPRFWPRFPSLSPLIRPVPIFVQNGGKALRKRPHDQLAKDLVQDRTDLSSQKATTPAALAPTSQSPRPTYIARDAAEQRPFPAKLESDSAPDFSVDAVPSWSPLYGRATNNGAKPKLASTYEIADLASFGSLGNARRFYEIGYQTVLK